MQQIQNDNNFEQQKNIKAFAYTATIAIALCCLFAFISWQVPQIPPPIASEGIEVNLGNSDFGMGNTEPQSPNDPGEQIQEAVTNNTPPQASTNENTDDVGDVPIASTPKTTVPKVTMPSPVKTPTVTPATKATPKAVFSGAKPNQVSGNKSDSYNDSKNQGITNGDGNQGNPNGKTNSDSYKGNSSTGSNGVTIRSGLNGRRFVQLPNFEDEFNENAKVAVDITVDESGKVTSALINPRGTTTTNSSIRKIALKKANMLKLNPGSIEQTGTIVFNFKVSG